MANQNPVKNEDILENEFYHQFLSEKFDVKEHASQVLQGSIVSEQLAKLADGLSLLDKAIQNQVSEHYEDLLKHASGIETLENVLSMMQNHIQGFSASIERLKTRISEPHNKLQTQTLMLSRLQLSCELLRRIIRILSLSKRLQVQLQAGPKEITKTAQTLSELDQLSKDVDLSGVEIIEKDQKLILQARIEVEKQAKVMLQKGLEAQNQSQVGTALQVFHNLGILEPTVESVLENARETLYSGLKRALDVEQLSHFSTSSSSSGLHQVDGKFKGPGRVAMPVTGSSPAFRTALWSNMEKLMDQIFNSCAQVQHLQKVLAKKRDPVTHVCFLEELNQNRNTHLVQRFWTEVTGLLTQEFNRAANESSHIKQAFEAEYPKLLRMSADLWGKLTQFHQEISSASGNLGTDEYLDEEQNTTGTNQFNAETALRRSLATFQNAYLSRSLSRLFDPVNLMFSSGGNEGLPSTDECDNLIKIIQSELTVSLVDIKLGQLVTKNVTKTIQMMAVKAEQLLISDGEASQVIGPPTAAQRTNAGAVNLLHQFDRNLRRAIVSLPGLSEDCVAAVIDSLKHIATLMRNSIQPLLTSLTDAVEAIVLTMHDEDFSSPHPPEDGAASAPCSLYMKELQSFLSRSAADYFSLYHSPDFLREELRAVATRCLDLFVRHASLLRPLGDGGKMKLAADFAQMELAISSFYDRPTELGRSYRVLRSFRPLLFQTVEHLAQSPTVGDVIPYSLVLHFLFARAPAELKSPHQGAGWSVVRYSKWLDEHATEKERLSVIQGALESYVQGVKQRQAKEFAKEYAIMVQLLQKALATL
ncbi:conserved oligomeric Golgi complex subunit 5-like [Daphnia pulicaria]|uniref:conserved oligomeric Golgi complex subunit 5-like n=1 Tax=Daphnia pulicaria TaxID=35523 RepID=UPI001EEA87A7|nr:conserved oligomeric Golgi complex subunit 5-like [Daphnia pulicaria]